MNKTLAFLIFWLIMAGISSCTGLKTCEIYFDSSVPQIKFAAEELKKELMANGYSVSENNISSFPGNDADLKVVVTFQKEEIKSICKNLETHFIEPKKTQSYNIRVKKENKNSVIAVLAGDANGAMYGTFDVADVIKLGTLNDLKNYETEPFVENRGIKFNIPLDMRSPTYSDKNDASQQNIPEMWSMDFWKEMLDEMARDRYNIISLWSLHPFPSMVKVPEFPDVALDDVWRWKGSVNDINVGHNGEIVDQYKPGNYEIIKKISIDEKIKFWQDVMQYGHERGISFYIFTWNIFTHGVTGKYGIDENQDNEKTIEYFRAGTRELVLTYPLLAGIGVTAGENMQNLKGEYTNEKWLWKSYGEGVRDALKIKPDRKISLIHRFHLASQSEILDEWKDYPGDFSFSFKYLYAHMYSDTKSVFIEPAVKYIAPNLKMWLELRNDDIYSFRWGDPVFAREFIKNLPPENKVAGFFIGPDGYCWGREFLSTTPETPRELVMKKQWFSFLMWGRLSFNPEIGDEYFQKTLEKRFPDVPSAELFQASQEASRIFPEITRFFWGDIDVKWFPEACITMGRFYTIRDFIMQGTMPGTNNINIKIWRGKKLNGETMDGKTPFEVANLLETYATNTLNLVNKLREIPSENKELGLTLGDYEAFAHLGSYYAEKIRGASYIALYDTTGNVAEQQTAIVHLKKALNHWKNYAAVYTKQNVQPVKYGRAGLVDIPGKLTEEVAKDIEMAKNWPLGTIKGPLVKRDELNFRQ